MQTFVHSQRCCAFAGFMSGYVPTGHVDALVKLKLISVLPAKDFIRFVPTVFVKDFSSTCQGNDKRARAAKAGNVSGLLEDTFAPSATIALPVAKKADPEASTL
eukprot:gb/GFBE01002410.1/.p2 GENE.gb/GFBE01002410.1/~~gb/GFBE01002410.1/.p2  ORF type:complete len:104 (-),score=1.89 gb/GFBE01002410.1/:6-317(-)